ncbi:MAG: biotin-dependent carboxyltransferase family protein [Bacillota bacterium]
MIEIIKPGRLTTVQDLGRTGYGHLGVPEAGAADTYSLRQANHLVGNADGTAALEMTGEGASLRFEAACHVALVGGELEANLNGEPVAMHQTLAVPTGAVLTCGPITRGWRCYLAVSGGFSVAPVMGSVSRDTLSGLGPEPLAAGQRLDTGPAGAVPGSYLRAPPRYGEGATLRVLAGPQQDWLAHGARRVFAASAYRVLPQSDRTGLRLDGPVLERRGEAELPSMGVVAGTVQLPPSGLPIVLLANHGATGGYPVIAQVISADLPALAQLAPGVELRFSEVDRATALALLREQERKLENDLVSADAALLAARSLMMLAGRHASLKQAVVGDGKRRIRIRRGQ